MVYQKKEKLQAWWPMYICTTMNILHVTILFFDRYIDDIIIFNLNNNTSSDLLVNYPDNLNFNENCLISNAIIFLDLKIILNSSQSLHVYLYDKHKDCSFNVNIFTKFSTYLHKSVFTNILLNFAFCIKIPMNLRNAINYKSVIKYAIIKV